jgi:hypothetical protein
VPASISVDPPVLSVDYPPWPWTLFTARGPLRPGRFHLALVGFALAMGAISLLFPSTPSYDPWSWIIWGREIIHGHLSTQYGPSWKPMPVIFTTVFALFGQASPDLWLLVARAGAVGTLVMVLRLAVRFTWALRAPGARDGVTRWVDLVPAGIAGAIAFVGVAGSASFGINSILGYSEGVMMFSVLLAFERHLDGHPRQAFAIAMVAALDRPETWVFWGPYGLWLMWRDPGSRALVVGIAVLVILLWFVPQKLGGNSFTSGVSRAHDPRAKSDAYKSFPFWSELSTTAWRQVELQVKLAAALAIIAALALLARMRDAGAAHGERTKVLAAVAALGLFGFAWWVLIALETQAGFSGNTRYLVLGSAALWTTGGIGFGWGALALARLLRRPLRGNRGAPVAGLCASAVLAAIGLFLPEWFPDHIVSVGGAHRAMAYQSRLRIDLRRAIAEAGGSAALRNCAFGPAGPGTAADGQSIVSEAFQVPMVAWYLNLRIDQVGEPPGQLPLGGFAPARLSEPPRVVIQDSATGGPKIFPKQKAIDAWEKRGANYKLFSTSTFHVYADCR